MRFKDLFRISIVKSIRVFLGVSQCLIIELSPAQSKQGYWACFDYTKGPVIG